MMPEQFDPDTEWLLHVRQTGLVVAPAILKELGLVPLRQTPLDSERAGCLIAADRNNPALTDPWTFLRLVLGWPSALVAGAPGGPALPQRLSVAVTEHQTLLAPDGAVTAGSPDRFQLLVQFLPAGVDPDQRGALEGWEASAHQRFERLLRETGVGAGVLVSDRELRLVHAPGAETSGWLSFPLHDLGTVAGRTMLAGLKLMLDSARLFTDPDNKRLPAVLEESRKAQASVSQELAGQVLGALHELLRGLLAAEPERLRALAARQPQHLYEGLLTVLMRLIFLLYAEDRGLLPSQTDAAARALYDENYSVRGLFARLGEDAARHPDTMDERRGAWGQLLALFRVLHRGDGSGWIVGRGGKLFDPEIFPFLMGRFEQAESERITTLSDGCLFRVLAGLMTLHGERLSYRNLDVEQIGSVYETIMGFTVECASGPSIAIRAGKNNHTPVFVDGAALAKVKPGERQKILKDETDRSQFPAAVLAVLKSATSAAEIAAALGPVIDLRGSPDSAPVSKGTPILQPTEERRRTGSHYTPRELTRPIVRQALAPVLERLGDAATPAEILDIKVCDPAMGSGAFLVEACRQLGERLVKAWASPGPKPQIPPDEDEELHARRLVAQRCLYGVDKNPMATDLARLSLWLATLARDHEFTFLDHALKTGDSLVGLSPAQIAAAHWDTSAPGLTLLRPLIQNRISDALRARSEIRDAPDNVARAIQEARHRTVEQRMEVPRQVGTAIVAAFFSSAKPREREKRRADIESWIAGKSVAWDKLADMGAILRQGARPLIPFHWQLEFPEVFVDDKGGFDVIVGNPPFMGGSLLSRAMGKAMVNWLTANYEPSNGKSDLVAFFFRQAFALLRPGGALGLIGTKTIRQGFSRFTSLEQIISKGGVIYRAIRRLRWPGEEASVVVAVVHIVKGEQRQAFLDGRKVERVTSFLLPVGPDTRPAPLSENLEKVYSGINPNGAGFVFDALEKETLIRNCARCVDFFHPYLSSNDLNGDPAARPTRFIVDVGSLSEDELKRYPALYDHLKATVGNERQKSSERRLREQWWKFSRPAQDLYNRIGNFDRVLAMGRLSTHHTFAFQTPQTIFSDALSVFLLDRYSHFAELQSRVHELWAKFLGSSFKDDPRYIPEDCFETFPFAYTGHRCESIGRDYYKHRSELMLHRNEGMTDIYNRFHDRTEVAEDIQQLRELHSAMDRSVLEDYGWQDLATRSSPIFLDDTNEDDHSYQGRLFWPSDFRDEVLARLLERSTKQHAKEIRLGIAPKRKEGEGIEEEEEMT
jgi:hypothetical protein